jgi:hypothetical protein
VKSVADKNYQGARYEINVDGKSRSYRDTKEVALEAAQYLKSQHPQSEVIVRDVLSKSSVADGREGERPK